MAPAAFDGQLLPLGIGCRDAFAAAVRRAADAAQDGIDRIAVALGVVETFEQEEGSTFTHHETVRPFTVGPRAGGRQGADLAEFGERRGAHIGVDAAGQDGVVIVLLEAFDGGGDRRHGRGAGGVDDVIGAVQVEDVGHPTGDDIGELAGHGVLVDLGQASADAGAQLVDDLPPRRRVELAERGRVLELFGVLGEEDAQRRHVVLVAGHGVAEDHRGALTVEGPLGMTVVGEGLAGAGDGPFLGAVHGVGDARRNRQAPGEGIPAPVLDPTTDLRVELVGCLGVGVVVEVRVPATLGDVADAVAAGLDVRPERRSVGRVG